ncbi:carcinoembryonic antigen-related cell adhesion molecule 20-like isoform X4 [Coregonus clupeaformis]|uniref:carcinoembryonic antigen-related cell adhesion molecule 20-like isoform X4 n=1 Tax=Coregonus clupeaformis TaxID=59861 RepID=UPI001E1C9547|nr:carcinoembryonic antigen-related cell adhesion molecule 20-like isoform X4 [Coregonus clupeaformis]
MVAAAVVFLTMAILSGYCAGLGVLPPGPVNGTLGGNVIFKTTINPTTLIFIAWTFGAPPVSIVNFASSDGTLTGEGYVGRISLDNSTGSLELRKLTLNDSGTFRVSLRKAGVINLGSTSLNVYDGPDGMEIKGPTEIELGQKLTLTCSADSNPPARYTWMLNETEIPGHSHEFTKENSEYSDRGNYTCTATNYVTVTKTSVVLKLSVKVEDSLSPGLPAGAIVGIVIGILLVAGGAVGVAVFFIRKYATNAEPMHRGGSQQPVYENPSALCENPQPNKSLPRPLTVSKTWLPGMCPCMFVFYYSLTVIKMTLLNKKFSMR